MLNAEKYKEEIARVGYDFGVSFDNTIVACSDCENCRYYGDECKRYGDSPAVPKVKWLLEEYEEPNPILTKEGKEFLRMMVADFNIYDIEYILKEEDENKVKNYLIINLRNGHVTTIYEKNSKECMLLKNMGNHQRYTAKELGL